MVHEAITGSESAVSLFPSTSTFTNFLQHTRSSGKLAMKLFDAFSSANSIHCPREFGSARSRLFEQSTLTREEADPISSGMLTIELKDTSSDFKEGSSPTAAGSSVSLLWLTFSTVNKGKFFRSSFNTSILLWAKISFCMSTTSHQLSPSPALSKFSYTSVGTSLNERFDKLRDPEVLAAFSTRSMISLCGCLRKLGGIHAIFNKICIGGDE
uniref:Uncharacterized protein n=1 Tax=Opuntia streptacantha TaxID=393608 RepID=A0A7C9AV31_OPUST